MDRAGPATSGSRHGIGPQGPVDLERRRAALRSARALRGVGREVVGPDHGQVQGVASQSASTARRAATLAAVDRAHADGAAPPDDDAVDAAAARTSTPRALGAGATRAPVRRPRAADRDGEPELLAEARQQPPEQRAAGALGRQVGVQRVAGEQQPAGLAGELLVGEAPQGDQRRAGRSRAGRRARRARPGAAPARTGGNGDEQGVEERDRRLLPLEHTAVRGAVAAARRVEAGRRRREVAVRTAAGPVTAGVGQDGRGVRSTAARAPRGRGDG